MDVLCSDYLLHLTPLTSNALTINIQTGFIKVDILVIFTDDTDLCPALKAASMKRAARRSALPTSPDT